MKDLLGFVGVVGIMLMGGMESGNLFTAFFINILCLVLIFICVFGGKKHEKLYQVEQERKNRS